MEPTSLTVYMPVHTIFIDILLLHRLSSGSDAVTMSSEDISNKRLFIGGLFEGITPAEVKERFTKFGDIHSVDVKVKKDFEGKFPTQMDGFKFWFHEGVGVCEGVRVRVVVQ